MADFFETLVACDPEPMSAAPAHIPRARTTEGKYVDASRARAHFTREKLAELFAYDPESGALTRRDNGEEVLATNNYGYRWVWIEGTALLVHRIVWRMMTGDWPAAMVDHIDGCRTNNRWANLRAADHSINAQNQTRAMCTNSTGFLGVTRDKRRIKNPFRAAIRIHGKHVALGYFPTPEEAYAAYLKAKAELHPGCALAQKAWPAT